MKTIVVRLLKTNSKFNRTLIEDVLPGSLNGVLLAGYEFKFQYTKGDNKTKYPAIYYNNKSYHGISEIQKGLSLIATTSNVRDMSSDQMHNYQLKGLWSGNDDNETGFDEIKPDEIQEKTQTFRNQRGARDVEQPTQATGTVPQAVPPIQANTHNTNENRSKPAQQSTGRKKVTEKMHDNDIGGTFAMIGNGSQDDELLQNLFVNQQESPV